MRSTMYQVDGIVLGIERCQSRWTELGWVRIALWRCFQTSGNRTGRSAWFLTMAPEHDRGGVLWAKARLSPSLGRW